MKYSSSNILLAEQPLIVVPKLAVLLGLNEALVLQQLHYWVNKSSNIRDGRRWVYNSITEWRKQFPFWSTDTVKRTVSKLVNSKLVIKDTFNRSAFDRTLWYTIDYDMLNQKIDEKFNTFSSSVPIGANCTNGLEQIETMTSEQIAPMDESNELQPIPEITTENTHTDKKKVSKKEGAGLPAFDELINNYTSNQTLQLTIKEFIKMRVSMKKTPTNHALKIIFQKLDKLTLSDELKVEMLNRSIVNNWGDVFEIKPPQGSLRSSSQKVGSPLEELEKFLREDRDEQSI